MLQITSPIHGAILNRHDGNETEDGLRIRIEGVCTGTDDPVTVNGCQTLRRGDRFSVELPLVQRDTELTAACGPYTSSVSVVYDRGSFPRYRFSLDDTIWCLQDIAAKGYASLFDNPFMGLWKRLHDTYGTKVNANIYYQCDGFNLAMMPDTYRCEWQDNADWLRLTFHAMQNDPDKPYVQARYAQMAHDCDLVCNEILRFAGEAAMNTFTTVHWGEATREACRALRDRGIEGLCGYFRLDKDGNPFVAYYLDKAHTDYLGVHDYWKDPAEELIFIRHDMVINGVPLERIGPDLDAVAANPRQRDVMELMIHEQYFHPHYPAYLSDYAERCETAVRWMAEHGYKPVFWSDGFLGVPE